MMLTITWTEGVSMQKKVREVMGARPPEISNDVVTIRDEVKNWLSSLKAPKDWDNGGAVSLKVKFGHCMRFGSNGTLLTEAMEIGERLLQWSKDQALLFHVYKQHLGGHRKVIGLGRRNTKLSLDNKARIEEYLSTTPVSPKSVLGHERRNIRR